ncbi:Serum response factor-binding protein 1 [Manis javanica]|nr:Serum response factor-binding protein 1 [Manis javanica]
MVHLSTTLPVIAGLACRQVLDGRACRTGAWPRSRRPAGTVHATGGSPPGSVVALPGTPSLSNEFVNVRKEVKRIRALVIRKLVRSVSRLKSKKGAEDALLKNQRQAQRLLEEICAMK